MAELAAPDCERMIVGDLEQLDFSTTFNAERFNVIVAADVLEHLRDPWSLLERAHQIIDPSGHLVLSIPNVAHAAILAGLLNGHFDYQEKGLLDRTHLRFFTRSGIEHMLLSTGWLPVAWDSNRISPLDSEFAHHWSVQPNELRQAIEQRTDSGIYQFIVKAIPANEIGWQQQLQTQTTQLTEQLQTQHRELIQTHASLREHQQAFEEAKAWIASLQREGASFQQENSQLQATLEQTQATLEQTQATLEQTQATLEQQEQQSNAQKCEAAEMQQRLELENASLRAELSRFRQGLIAALRASIADWLSRRTS
jgi:hypothetical protein